MTKKNVTMSDLATVIRSKNAGPFLLTLDIFFNDEEIFCKVRDSGVITRELIAKAYRVKESDIQELTFFDPVAALKITMTRWVGSAAPGDTDVFGAQQHVPIMNLIFQLDG
jgi:hypothetical protein